jgi:hypothetical protein
MVLLMVITDSATDNVWFDHLPNIVTLEWSEEERI